MKMKKTSKIIKVIIAIAVFVAMNGMFTTEVKAADTADNIRNAASSWIAQGESQNSGEYLNPTYYVGEFIGIGQVLVTVGIATLIIVSVIMAIRWLTATPDKQAKLKVQLIGLLVSAFVIFGAVGIWNFIQNIMSQTGL